MRYREDELAGLFGDLLEDLLLQKLDIDDCHGAAGLLGCEEIPVAGGNGDVDGLHFGLR